MAVGSLRDPEYPQIVHATDPDGLVCRFDYETSESAAWPPRWWDREQHPGDLVTCLRCVRWRR